MTVPVPPVVTVLIPTYGRAEALRTALGAWERQEPTDLDFEVVVIDDGSPDDTRELLASHRSERFHLRRLSQANAGPAAARNAGMAVARGEIVLFTGDDIEPAPDLLEQHLAGHSAAADPDVAVLGMTRWPEGAALTATMRHVDGVGAQQFSYHWLSDGAEYDFRHFYTSNISVHRSVLDREPEGFCTDFPLAAFEDAEFAHRLAGHGMRIRYRASALAFHHHRYDVRSFFERQRRCGLMAALLWRRRPVLARWLSIRDLDRLRLASALADGRVRRTLDAVASNLEYWEGRALALAAFYDEIDPPPKAQDDVLHSLFLHAFLRGLAEGVEGNDFRRTAAAAFLALIPSAVTDYRAGLEVHGFPCPSADAAALAGLAENGGTPTTDPEP